eukprot:7760151-Pyramimonas_sp.AAC.1
MRYSTSWSRAGTACFHVSRSHKGGIEHAVPELEPRRFTCPGHPSGYRTWWSRAGTTFSRAQATQVGI